MSDYQKYFDECVDKEYYPNELTCNTWGVIVWDHQQAKLNSIEKQVDVLKSCIERIRDTECAGCNLDEVLESCKQALAEFKSLKYPSIPF